MQYREQGLETVSVPFEEARLEKQYFQPCFFFCKNLFRIYPLYAKTVSFFIVGTLKTE